jgi:hypothetical protein
MTKISIDLLGVCTSRLIALSTNVVGHFVLPFLFGEDLAEHVLNLLFKEEVNIVIIIRIGHDKDLLPAGLVGTLEIEFELGEECSSIIPSHEFSST